MRYRTKVVSLTAAIVVLAATYFVGGVFTAQKAVDKKSMEPMFDISQREALTAVKVSTKGGILTLEKGADMDEWKVRIDEQVTYPASNVRINSLLNSVFDVTKYRLVGHGEKYWSEFELEENRADTVEALKDGESLFKLYVGKEGPGRKGDYVRSSLSDEIYLTDATMQRHFDQDPRYWFNMRLFPERYIGEDMFAISITDLNSGNRIAIKKDKPDKTGQWENLVPGGKVPVKFGADTIANKLSMLEAVNFVNGVELKPNVTMELDTAEFGHWIIDCQRIIDEGKFFYLLKRRGDSYMYLIEEEKMQPIFNPKDLYQAD